MTPPNDLPLNPQITANWPPSLPGIQSFMTKRLHLRTETTGRKLWRKSLNYIAHTDSASPVPDPPTYQTLEASFHTVNESSTRPIPLAQTLTETNETHKTQTETTFPNDTTLHSHSPSTNTIDGDDPGSLKLVHKFAILKTNFLIIIKTITTTF